MKLAISNIAWAAEDDEKVYKLMQQYGFVGLEIAPTRIFIENPYDQLFEAREWSALLYQKEGFFVPSMQSIWYGKQERMFGTEEERNSLTQYTKKAIDFAEVLGCHNLVFGCPKNRILIDGADADQAISFLKELGDYAAGKGTVVGMEANPTIYNTNYINDTASALELIRTVDSAGFLLNLDIGTMIQNEESIDILEDRTEYINHVHISEPYLKLIEKRELHHQLALLLKKSNYDGFVSIEMGKVDSLKKIEDTMCYIAEVFC